MSEEYNPTNSAEEGEPIQFGRYQLIAPIATGGMGEVFLAKSVGAGGFEKRVVLKRIISHLAQDPVFVQRFIDEGRLVVQLSHVNIAQVFDMGEVDQTYFIAMEYVDGCDLRELLRRCLSAGQRVPVGLVLFIVSSVAAGLAYAHAREDSQGRNTGIVHRDVSPSNIMLSKDGAVKLVDFGVAKAASRLSQSVSGAIRGKFQYMSPEQASGSDLDGTSDVFSLGVVAYELLSGSRPFDADTDVGVLDRVRFAEPKPLGELVPELPVSLVNLVSRALSKDPKERPDADMFRKESVGILYDVGEIVTGHELGVYVGETLALPFEDAVSLDGALIQALGHASPMGGTDSSPGGGTATYLPQATNTPSSIDTESNREDLVREKAPRSMWTGTSVRSLRVLVGILVVLVVALIGVNVVLMDDRWVEGERPPQRQPTISEDQGEIEIENPSAKLPQSISRTETMEEFFMERRGPQLSKQAPLGSSERFVVAVETEPNSARIFVDGKFRGVAPLEITVVRDEIVSGVARLAGYKSTRFQLSSDGAGVERVKLRPLEKGTVRFRFRPADARVSIDGRSLGLLRDNVVTRKLAVGSHRIKVVGPNNSGTVERSFDIQPGERVELGTLEP